MAIMAKMINYENKSLLIYAAEKHNRVLVDVLIKYGADVDMLYQLLGKDDSKSSNKKQEECITCKSCGKKISMNAKFCNFCGHKTEN